MMETGVSSQSSVCVCVCCVYKCIHVLRVCFDGNIQAGLCLQRIGAGERDHQGLNHGHIADQVDKQTVGVDGVAAVGLEREGEKREEEDGGQGWVEA